MNPSDKGSLSELKIITRLVELGATVSLPFGGAARYDLIEDSRGSLARVQVKTGNLQDGVIKFKTKSVCCRTGKGKPYQGEIEAFIVYCPQNDKCYWISVDDVGVSETYLRIEPTKNNREQGIKWAKHYEL